MSHMRRRALNFISKDSQRGTGAWGHECPKDTRIVRDLERNVDLE